MANNNNNNNKQDAGIGVQWENNNEAARGYVPSMLRRSLIPSYWKKDLLGGIDGDLDIVAAVPQRKLESARKGQSGVAAKQFYPLNSTPYYTLKGAYMRFGAENQDYYKKNGVIPPANMKRN